jgi:hypothetical protein
MKATPRKYSCVTCGSAVVKPPCLAVSDKQKKEGAKVTYRGLGHWTCEKCGKNVRVKCELISQ